MTKEVGEEINQKCEALTKKLDVIEKRMKALEQTENPLARLERATRELSWAAVEVLKIFCLQAGKKGFSYREAEEKFNDMPWLDDWWQELAEEYPGNEDGEILWHPEVLL